MDTLRVRFAPFMLARPSKVENRKIFLGIMNPFFHPTNCKQSGGPSCCHQLACGTHQTATI